MWNTQIPWLEIRNFKTKVKCPLELGFHGITWPRAQRNGEIPGEAGHPPRCQRPLTDDYWWKKIDFVTGKSSFSLWCWFVWQPFACSSFIIFFLPSFHWRWFIVWSVTAELRRRWRCCSGRSSVSCVIHFSSHGPPILHTNRPPTLPHYAFHSSRQNWQICQLSSSAV